MGEADHLQAALRGDTQAFGRLVLEHAPAVLKYVGGLAALPAGEREEIVQEAFVRAFEKLDQFDPARSFAAWVGGFARNVLLEHLARVKRQLEARQKLVDAASAEAGLRLAQDNPGRIERRIDALQHCVELLPEPMRRVLREHYCEGRPVAAIAAQLDRPVGTVKSILHRSRLELRNCMSRKLIEESA